MGALDAGKSIGDWLCLILRIVFGLLLLVTIVAMLMSLIRGNFQNVDIVWFGINVILVGCGCIAVALEHLGACIVYIILYAVLIAFKGKSFMTTENYDYILNIVVPVLYGVSLMLAGKFEMGVPAGMAGK